MTKWKCTMRTNTAEVVFFAPDENLKDVLATMGDRNPKKSEDGYIFVDKEDISSGQPEDVSIHWSDITFFSFEKITSNEE